MEHPHSVLLQGLRASEGSCHGVKEAQGLGVHWELGSAGRTLTGAWPPVPDGLEVRCILGRRTGCRRVSCADPASSAPRSLSSPTTSSDCRLPVAEAQRKMGPQALPTLQSPQRIRCCKFFVKLGLA